VPGNSGDVPLLTVAVPLPTMLLEH
jgi:hypothetical protein